MLSDDPPGRAAPTVQAAAGRASGGRPNGLRTTATDYFCTISAIDLRTLALFRICLGLLVLADLGIRAADLAVFHTDQGVLPRANRLAIFGRDHWLSLADIGGGSTTAAATMFVLDGLAATALIAGFRARSAALVCWLFSAGLRVRMPLIVTGGDNLLTALLLWSVFLPIGVRFSVDASRAEGRPLRADRTGAAHDAAPDIAPRNLPTATASFATFVILFQVASLFVLSGCAKLGDTSWQRGDGVYYALSAEFYTTPLAHALREVRGLMAPLTFAVLAFEVAAPLLLLSPWRNPLIRTAFVATAILMNLAFWLCLRIGIFSWVTMAAVLLFLPTEAWDRRFRSSVPSVVPWRPERSHRRQVASIALALLFVLMLAGNTRGRLRRNLPLPGFVWTIINSVGLEQRGWPMFSPTARDHGWFVVPGALANGAVVDLYEGGTAVDYQRPPLLSADFASYRWRKFFMNLKRHGGRPRELYAEHLCRQWNGHHAAAERVVELELVYMREVTLPDYRSAPARGVSLLRHRCR